MQETLVLCGLDPHFGQNGATTVSFPGPGLSVHAVLPTPDGGALLGGSTADRDLDKQRWLVGKITADGRPDPTFGNHGWTALPWRGDVDAMALTKTGDVVLGGYYSPQVNGGSLVSEISARGQLVTTFGALGRAPMPNYHDGGLESVRVEPDGKILVLIGGGNMGCFGETAITLLPNGVRVPGFRARFMRAIRAVDPPRGPSRCYFPVLVGDLEMGQSGFHLIGTSQHGCVANGCTEHPGIRDPSERVSDIALNFDGELDRTFGDNGITATPGPIADGAWALPQADDSLLLVTSPDNIFDDSVKHSTLLVYHFLANGRLDRNYAKRGVATIPQPYDNDAMNVPLDDGPASIPVSNGNQTVIVACQAPGKNVILIPVPAG